MRKLLAFWISLAISAAVAAPSFALTPQERAVILNYRPPAATGSGGFSLVYESSASSTDTTHTTIDFGTLTYGSGCTRVVVAVSWYTGASSGISGLTIGGIALAHISGSLAVDSPSNNISSDVWESTAALTGPSGDVQVTFASAQTFVASVALYCLTTTTPTASATAVNGGITVTSLTAPSTGTITIPSGGGGLVITHTNAGKTATFTNAAVDADSTTGGTNQYYAHTTATGAITVTANYSGSDAAVISVVAWGP
jgi:hypothetical protein